MEACCDSVGMMPRCPQWPKPIDTEFSVMGIQNLATSHVAAAFEQIQAPTFNVGAAIDMNLLYIDVLGMIGYDSDVVNYAFHCARFVSVEVDCNMTCCCGE